MLRLNVSHHVELHEWDALVKRFGGSFFLRPECLSTYGCDYIPCYCTFSDDSAEPVGIAFGALIPSNRRVLRHIFRSLYFPTLPLSSDGSRTVMDRMLSQLISYGKRQKVTSLTIDSFYAETAYPRFTEDGFTIRRRWEFLLDLHGSEQEIWDRMHPHHKRYAKYSAKKGLTFKEDNSSAGIACLMALQANARQRTARNGGNYTLPSSHIYLVLRESILERGYGSIFIAAKDGIGSSAVLVTTYNQKAYLIFAGTSPEGYQLRAPTFLYWNTAMELKQRGIIEWNLGGVPGGAEDQECQSHGLFTFKERFGGKRIPCVSADMVNINRVRSSLLHMGRALTLKSD